MMKYIIIIILNNNKKIDDIQYYIELISNVIELNMIDIIFNI